MNDYVNESSSSLRHIFQVGDCHRSSSFVAPPRSFLVASSELSIPWDRGTSRTVLAPPADPFFLWLVTSAFPLHQNLSVLNCIPGACEYSAEILFSWEKPQCGLPGILS